MLVLSPAIKVPSIRELGDREDAAEVLAMRASANITQGFRVSPNRTRQLPFAFLAEININNNKLWDLFTALAADMPGELCCTYGLQEAEEVTTTGYFEKADILTTLTTFKQELTMDGYLQFGLLYQTKELLTEIFVSESKYIKFWGNDKAVFLRHMQKFCLHEINDLAFIDEYPKTVLPLRNFLPTAKRPEDVVRLLNKAFGL